jgi:hypothetical protein
MVDVLKYAVNNPKLQDKNCVKLQCVARRMTETFIFVM